MGKDAIDELLERIDTDFGEDFKVSNGSPVQTAHAPATYKVNNIRPALYLNELIENGHCLCGLPLFFPSNPGVDILNLEKDLEGTAVGFMLRCRRYYHRDYEFIQFNVSYGYGDSDEDEDTYLNAYIRYWCDSSRKNDDFGTETFKETEKGRVYSAGYKKLMRLFTENNPPLSDFFQYFNKFLDTTDEYVRIRVDLIEDAYPI